MTDAPFPPEQTRDALIDFVRLHIASESEHPSSGPVRERYQEWPADARELGRYPVYQSDLPQLKAMEQAVLNDPKVKSALPEMALIELKDRFLDIHDPDRSGGITKDELSHFIAARNESNAFGRAALDYALNHFDFIRALDPKGAKSDTISFAAVEAGIGQLGSLEAERSKLEFTTNAETALKYLDANFNQIHNTSEFPGISKRELETYIDDHQFDSRTKGLSTVAWNHDDFTKLDTSDGGTTWGFFSVNAVGITRQDIAAGLRQAKDNRPLIAQLQARLDSWPK